MIVAFSHIDNSADVANKLTHWFTRSVWVHAELILEPTMAAWSARPDGKGVSVLPAKQVVSGKPTWEFWHVPDSDRAALLRWLLAQEGKKYDYGDLVRMVSPVPLVHTDRWFCSELCYVAVKDFGRLYIPEYLPDTVFPAMFREIIIEAGAKQLESKAVLDHILIS